MKGSPQNLSDLPEIDCLLITQSLHDHCHLKTLNPFSQKFPNTRVIATPNAKTSLDPLFRNGIVAAGLTQYRAYSTDEVMALLQQGNCNRTTERTRANETSSRSHAVLQVVVTKNLVMTKNLEHVLSMVLNSFPDPNPLVRWAAINAIGQLSTDLGPNLQINYHHLVLPALAGAMDDFQNPRVQAHAASAVLNFTESCNPDILIPYLDGIVSKLLVLLQGGNQMVQEGALTALASVADSSKEKFQKYYDDVTPYLKAILLNANDKSNRMLRAKAMECISLVGMAVGKEKFRDDAKQVIDVLMSLQQSQLDADDPTASYMLQEASNIIQELLENIRLLERKSSSGKVV